MGRGAWWATVHGVTKSQRDCETSLSLFTFMHWRRKWQPTPVSMGSHRVGHNWRDLAVAAAKPWNLPWWLRWQRICLQCRRLRFNPWVRNIPWRREWLPTPVLLPAESHGLRSLVGSMGSQRLRHDWATKHTHTMKPAFWEKMWKPLSREAEGCLRFSYLRISSAGGLLISLCTAQVPRWIRDSYHDAKDAA